MTTKDNLESIDWGDDDQWSYYGKSLPESLRDAGYKNAAYALGELVDNSIQADAANIDIIMFESNIRSIKGRRSWLVDEIGILDNGTGMGPLLQRASIKFQDGSHQRNLERGRKGNQMGKFGVGLPQASISQAKKLEIYSWTNNGYEDATYTYIDFEEPSTFRTVPIPIMKKIPEKWIKSSNIWGTSGTLVIWSKLDKFSWKTSKSVHRNTEYVVGRMYRKHISEDGVGIRIAAYENQEPFNPRWTDRDGDNIRSAEETHDWSIRANDPLYLDENAFAGNPPETPMFKDVGTETLKFNITDSDGKIRTENVTLRFSIGKTTSREGHGYDSKKHKQGLGGSQEHGRHANNNLGLSIVRARRELELDDGYSVGAKNAPWERWWGAEVSFEPGMDEVLRVTNNKQHAQALNDVSKKDWESFGWDDEESILEIKERLEWEDFSTFVAMTIKERIEKNLKILRDQIRNTSIQKKSQLNNRHEGPEDQGTKGIKKRQEQGKIGASDLVEDGMSEEEKRKTIRENLTKQGMDGDLIDHLEGKLIDSGYKIAFSERPMDSEAFFSVQQEIGSLIVFANESHAAFGHLFAALDSAELKGEDLSKNEIQQRAIHAAQTVKLLLGAWARYEDEASNDERTKLIKIRREWGSVAQSLMDDFAGGYNDV